MLSRVADSLYWMSRYLERAEHMARVLDVYVSEQLEEYSGAGDRRWRSVVDSLGLEAPSSVNEGNVGYWLAFDIANRSSIVACIMSARDNARNVREQISSEMWEHLNRLFHQVRAASLTEDWSADQHAFLTEVKDGAHLFQGITDSTMNHGEGWHFIQLGRFIERAVSVSSVVDVHFRDHMPADDGEHHEGVDLLKSCTAFEAYCKVYTAELKPLRISEFLLLNHEFPHSVCFAVDQVEVALRALPQSADRRIGGKALRLAGKLKATLTYGQIDEIMTTGLHAFLAEIDRQCNEIHVALHQIYIEYPIESAIEV
ncbi:MAG: alpha-E domain-containing protein [Bryobacterales bacterium]|nr:alpha-E domain-containing protein [Bryobacterales bacterium]